jgi:tetratricopeptide (TPR) repeat protein
VTSPAESIHFTLEPALRRRVAVLAGILAATIFLSAILIDMLNHDVARSHAKTAAAEPRPPMLHPLPHADPNGGRALLEPQKGGTPLAAKRVAALTRQARRLCDAGNFQGASEFYRAILDLAPNHIEARLALGSIALYQKRYATAEKYLGDLLRQLPHDDPVIRMRLGSAQFRRGKIGLGLENLKRAFRSLPDDGTLCFELACAYAALGDRTRAIFYLDRAEKALGGRLLAFISDRHLDSLRQDERFKEILCRARDAAKAAAKNNPDENSKTPHSRPTQKTPSKPDADRNP